MEGPLPLWGRAFVVSGAGSRRRLPGSGDALREPRLGVAVGVGVGLRLRRYPTGMPGVTIPRPPVTVLSPEIVTGQLDAS